MRKISREEESDERAVERVNGGWNSGPIGIVINASVAKRNLCTEAAGGHSGQ